MKALTVGSAMIDTIAVIANERIEHMTMRNAETSFLLLEEGSKTEADDISTHCGGGGVNAAVALARLGHEVAALIKVGQDPRAETILTRLASEGVSTRFAVRDARAPTGASVFVSAHDRDAAIFTFRGANTLLEAEDIRADAFAADLVYVSSLSDESADRFPLTIERAEAGGALIATNPGIRQLSLRQGTFLDVIGKIDILAFNRREASALVSWLVAKPREGRRSFEVRTEDFMPDLARRGFVAGDHKLSLAGFFEALHTLGPRWVVITDGKNGAYVGSPQGILHCPAVSAKVAGTAGAGDAFIATFAAFIASSASAEDAMIASAINAASVIGHLDTQTGLLRRPELDAQVAALRETIRITWWRS